MIEEAVIGPVGGAVEIPHFVKLVVPAGALQQNTEVTIATVDFPSILISRTGVHWSSGYPWSHVQANLACPEIKLDKVLLSPAFHVNLHGAKLSGKVPVEVQTWRPPGTEDHKCIILHHDDITGWKDISAEADIRVTEEQLAFSLTQCSTIVTIWIPFVLFSITIATAPWAPDWALAVLGTTTALTAGEYLVGRIRDRCSRGTLKCRFSVYVKAPDNLNPQDHVEFHVLCRESRSQIELQCKEAYEGFVYSGDNTSEVRLFNGDNIEVHVEDISGEHETIYKGLIVDADECRSAWGKRAQLIVPRKPYYMGTVTIKKNQGTQHVCQLTFRLPPFSPSHQQPELSESDIRLLSEPTERPSKNGASTGGHHQRTTMSSEQPRKKKSIRSGADGHGGGRKAKYSILLVSDEYCTSKGGISTINLNVARKFTAAGAEVYATVLEASEQDERDAKKDGVTLLKPLDPNSTKEPSLEWLTTYHSVHFPDLPPNISCIVGHVHVTSTAARRIKEERFPHAKLAMFGHVMPEETEPYKSDDKALGVGRKEASIQDDLGKADVVFSVGARIYRHYARFLRQRHVDHHIFLPEPSKVFCVANVGFSEENNVQKPERVILSIGRVRNVERLKGHDLAAGAIDKVAERLDSQFTLRLRVRGIDKNDFNESKRILDEKLRSGRVKPTLLPYGTQEEIRRDMENCHLVLMPSRAEPFGLVGLEAIAAGVPVLISEQSGLAEMVKELSDRLGQPKFRHCIVKMKGNAATDTDTEKWADCIEDFLTNAKSEFAEARTFREKLLASKYWEESHQNFLHACGITDDASAQAQGGGAEADD